MTALSAARAAKLSGTHLHRLFAMLPPRSHCWNSAPSIAAIALRRLQDRPALTAFLRDIRLLLVDELCQANLVARHNPYGTTYISLLCSHCTQHPTYPLCVTIHTTPAQVGGDLLSAIDLILRSIRGVDKFMGGVFLISAGDHHQCGAVADLHPPLLSTCVRSNFDTLPMYTLFRYICARGDFQLQVHPTASPMF